MTDEKKTAKVEEMFYATATTEEAPSTDAFWRDDAKETGYGEELPYLWRALMYPGCPHVSEIRLYSMFNFNKKNSMEIFQELRSVVHWCEKIKYRTIKSENEHKKLEMSLDNARNVVDSMTKELSRAIEREAVEAREQENE